MKKRVIVFILVAFLPLLLSPLFVSAKDTNGVIKRSKFNIEDFVDTSKPFKTENGEFVDTLEYFKGGIKSITPNVIIGPDGRTKVEDPFIYPYRAMVYIILEFEHYVIACTGSIVGDYKVLTNAHCLSEEDPITGNFTNNKPIFSAVLTGVKDNHYSMAYFGESYHFPSEFPATQNVAYDYGVIILEDYGYPQSPGELWGFLPIRITNDLPNGQTLHLYGYPGDKIPPLDLWGMSGTLVAQNDRLIVYDMDTYSGQSGSAVLNNNYEIVAIHSGGLIVGNEYIFNGGPKMIKSLYNQR